MGGCGCGCGALERFLSPVVLGGLSPPSPNMNMMEQPTSPGGIRSARSAQASPNAMRRCVCVCVCVCLCVCVCVCACVLEGSSSQCCWGDSHPQPEYEYDGAADFARGDQVRTLCAGLAECDEKVCVLCLCGVCVCVLCTFTYVCIGEVL